MMIIVIIFGLFFVEEFVVFVLMISIWIRFTYRKRGFLSITSVIM
jgi:hypothetical protein